MNALRWIGIVTLGALSVLPAMGQSATGPDGTSADVLASDHAALSRPVADIVRLTSSGVSDDVIVAYINGSNDRYGLSANDILALKAANVSSRVIAAMIGHDALVAVKTGDQPPAQPAPAAPQPAAAPQAATAPTDTTQYIGADSPMPGVLTTEAPSVVDVEPVIPGPDIYIAPDYYYWHPYAPYVGPVWGPHYHGFYGTPWRR